MLINNFNVSSPAGKNLIKKGSIRKTTKERVNKGQDDSVILGQQDNSPINLHILHINDFHGAVEPFKVPGGPFPDSESEIGGIANLKSVINRERERDLDGTMLFNAGDLAEGSMISYVSKGRVVGEAFNNFGFDAITPGNHDFSWGKDGFNHMVQDIEAPILGANIVQSADGKVMEGLKPYTIIEKKGC